MPRPDVERGEGRGEYGMLPCYVDSGGPRTCNERGAARSEMSYTGTCSYISLSHTHVTKCVGVSLWPCSFLCDSCGLGGVCSPPSANARTCADADFVVPSLHSLPHVLPSLFGGGGGAPPPKKRPLDEIATDEGMETAHESQQLLSRRVSLEIC